MESPTIPTVPQVTPQVTSIGPNTVNPPSKSGPSMLVLALVLAAIALTVGIVGGIIYLINPTSELFEEPITQASLLEVIRNADKPISLSAQEYEKYFALHVDGEQFPKYTPAGNILAAMNEGQVTLLFSPIPNINLNNEQAFIYFDSVKSVGGVEMTDQTFNTEFFSNVDVEGMSTPVAHMKVDRYAPLASGTKVEDIASVVGRLVIKVPVDIATTTATQVNLNTEIATPYATVTIKEFGESSEEEGKYTITVGYLGFAEKFMKAVPLDDRGKEIQHGWSKRMQEGYGDWEIGLYMDTRPTSVAITEAGGMLVKEFPFTLEVKPSQISIDPVTQVVTEIAGTDTSVAKVTEAEKLSIVAAEEIRYKVFSSRDLTQIRPFLEKITLDPEVKTALMEASDQEILGMIDFMLSSDMYATPGAAKIALLDPRTEWTKVSDTEIKVKIDFGGGNKLTISYRKINGAWM